jgi:outer membrane usher protein
LLGEALLPAALAAAAGPAGAAALLAGNAPDIEGEPLYLEVTINHARTPVLAAFVLRDRRFFASAITLRLLGFRIDEDDRPRALDEIPGAVVRYDEATQRLDIDAPLAQMALPVTVLNRPEDITPVAADSPPGLLANYDLYASRQQRDDTLVASVDTRLFGLGDGVLDNTAILRATRTGDTLGWRGDSVRLDTRWTVSFPSSAVELTLGDTYSGFLDWTRPLRLGGVTVGRNFALQPYRITAPLPTFLGEATVPSSVELYVNGLRQYGGELPPGPFQLSAVPGLDGTGMARIVVTDAFGRTRAMDMPFYATQRLLAKGLSDWSISVGTVRKDYGLRSFEYASDLVGSGTLRYGISDRFTFEGHAEGTSGMTVAGAGGVWLLGRGGVLGASLAGSTATAGTGTQTAVSYQWNDGRFNVALDHLHSHGDYRDVASRYGPLPARTRQRVLVGHTSQRLGSLSLTWVKLESPHAPASRYAGAFWSRSFAGGWAAYFSLNQNLDDHRDRSAVLGVSIALDDVHASASWQRNGTRDSGVADVSRPVPGDGGFGWRVQARGGDTGGGGLAEAAWINDAGRFGLGVASSDGDGEAYATAAGALVLMDGHAFAARRIDDAFAIVSTDGVANVPVKLENRPIGHTDADGKLLVTPLNAWQRNKLSIDALALPANLRIGEVDQTTTPRTRAGVRVRFELAPLRAAVLVLHDAAGRPLAVGSTVHADGSDSGDAMVGRDGETYLEALQPHNALRVQTPDGACRVAFDAPATDAIIPRIGPLTCLPDAP